MKSAMQELIEWLNGFDGGQIRPTILRINEKATELLEKEKQQLEEYSQSKIQELEKENERWRGLVEKTFFTSIHAIHRTKQAWQQFKEQNNL